MISTYLKHEYFRESHLFVSLPVMIVVIYTFHSHCFLVININFAVRTARSEKLIQNQNVFLMFVHSE